MRTTRSNPGFTLVELLVVSALFLLFFSLAVTAARPNPASQVRQLTQDLTSAILAAQTRAMSSESGAALMIDSSGAAVFNAHVLPPVFGTVTVVSPTSSPLTGVFDPINATDLNGCFAVQLFRQETGMVISPWMDFNGSTAGLATAKSQTTVNTVIPAATPAVGFTAARYPLASDPAVNIPRFAAIDPYCSGVGMVSTDPFGTLFGSGTVSLRFDRSGCLDMLTRAGPSGNLAITPQAPFYLLIATPVEINARTSLRSPLSRWIAIAPDTGRVTVALNVPGNYAIPPSQADINNARFNARQAITQGAR